MGPRSDVMSGDFSSEQKRYLEGLLSGVQIARAARTLGGGAVPAVRPAAVAPAAGAGPDAPHLAAQERDEPPKPPDNFRWRFYGLFYVAPAQSSYMCRLRIPNGIMRHGQLAGLGD